MAALGGQFYTGNFEKASIEKFGLKMCKTSAKTERECKKLEQRI
jgi:hypothetical protein